MKSQLQQAIFNLEKVITTADYEPEGIVRLNLYTTSMEELWPHFSILQEWIAQHNIKSALTAMEVKVLFETLKVELEATVVKWLEKHIRFCKHYGRNLRPPILFFSTKKM